MEGWKAVKILAAYGEFYLAGNYLIEIPADCNHDYLQEEAECRATFWPWGHHFGSYLEVPSKDCYCGYYAFKEYEEGLFLARLSAALLCQVWGRGRVVETEKGFRSELIDLETMIWLRCEECDSLTRLIFNSAIPSVARLSCPNHLPLYVEGDYPPVDEPEIKTFNLLETYSVLREISRMRQVPLVVEEAGKSGI